MSYIAVIVESPAKCKKIEQYLGPGYKCIASYGHIRTLDHINNINIDKQFEISYTDLPNKTKQISILQTFVRNASDVLLASDDDREGEAIAWHICQVCNLSVETTKRIIFHEITAQALQSAVVSPVTINMKLVHAQQARQVLDILVGFKISPILWNNISSKTNKSLSAGRCQTPALRIIYENQKDIDTSVGNKVYNTIGYFTSHNLDFSLNYNYEDEDKMELFLKESSAFTHIYHCQDVKKSVKKPPIPFTTSSLQQKCSSELRMTPKSTMTSCQKLYEAGYITYMRTDCSTYSNEFIDIVNKYILAEYGAEYIPPKITKTETNKSKKTKKNNILNAQEAHEAIRPTNIQLITIDPSEHITQKEIKVYAIIRRNTLESCMPSASYNVVTAKITAPEKHEYSYSTEQVVFPGWNIVAGYTKINPTFNFILSLKSDMVIEYKRIISKVTMKNIKSHFTEAKLVNLLERHGIGRPSTFASIIDKIQEREYVKVTNVSGVKVECIDFELHKELIQKHTTEKEFGAEKGKLVIQPLGIIVIEFLLQHFDVLFQYEYTKKMEDLLDSIAHGEYVWYDLCRCCLTEIESLTKCVNNRKQVISIDKNHTFMIAKYGPVIKRNIEGETTFLKVREDINIEKLNAGEYKLEDIIDTKTTSSRYRILGKHLNSDVVLKKGRFGLYLEWNNVKINVTHNVTEYDSIELADIVDTLVNPIITEITKEVTIRNGKYGPYIYYKTQKMTKPKFISFDKCISSNSNKKDIKEWLREKHKLPI